MPDPYPRHDLISDDFDRPTRVSALAVSSLVFGILCCIPGLGLIALILGAAGLIQIRDPEKRLSGKSLAIIGMVLGALGTVLWVASAVGALTFMNSLHVYGNVVDDTQNGNLTRVRASLVRSTDAAVTDEQLKDFGNRITAEWGHYKSMPKGLGEWLSGYVQHADAVDRARAASGMVAPGGTDLPLPMTFDQGQAITVFVLDPRAASPGGFAQIINFGVVDKAGKVLWLIDPATPGAAPSTGPSGRAKPAEAPATTGPTGPSGPASPSGS